MLPHRIVWPQGGRIARSQRPSDRRSAGTTGGRETGDMETEPQSPDWHVHGTGADYPAGRNCANARRGSLQGRGSTKLNAFTPDSLPRSRVRGCVLAGDLRLPPHQRPAVRRRAEGQPGEPTDDDQTQKAHLPIYGEFHGFSGSERSFQQSRGRIRRDCHHRARSATETGEIRGKIRSR